MRGVIGWEIEVDTKDDSVRYVNLTPGRGGYDRQAILIIPRKLKPEDAVRILQNLVEVFDVQALASFIAQHPEYEHLLDEVKLAEPGGNDGTA